MTRTDAGGDLSTCPRVQGKRHLLAMWRLRPDVHLGVRPQHLKLDETGEALRFARIAMTVAPSSAAAATRKANRPFARPPARLTYVCLALEADRRLADPG